MRQLGANLILCFTRRGREWGSRLAPLESSKVERSLQTRHTVTAGDHPPDWRDPFLQLPRFLVLTRPDRRKKTQTQKTRRHATEETVAVKTPQESSCGSVWPSSPS